MESATEACQEASAGCAPAPRTPPREPPPGLTQQASEDSLGQAEGGGDVQEGAVTPPEALFDSCEDDSPEEQEEEDCPCAGAEARWRGAPSWTRRGRPGYCTEVPEERREICTAGGRRPAPSDFSHCPIPQSYVRCGPHHRAELCVLSKGDINDLCDIWWRYRDDLTWPWYEKKPQFSDADYITFRSIAQKVVDGMIEEFGEPMVLDQATISNTNHIGHPPHADNVQFDSVWWKGKRIRSEDEVVAAREGAYVLWRPEKTSYRSYSCSVSLTDPSNYVGGEVQFFSQWGDKDPIASYKCAEGCGIAFCGCQRNIHAVTGVRSGFRLVLLVWTRPPLVRVPDSQAHVCYFRPGTGMGVWMTTADIQQREARSSDSGKCWLPVEKDDGCQCSKCVTERCKVAWKDCVELRDAVAAKLPPEPLATPTTSAGSSPRPSDGGPSPADEPPSPCREDRLDQPVVGCATHERKKLQGVLSNADVRRLYRIWQTHQDDLSHPWYDKKPSFEDEEFRTFRDIAQKVVTAMAEEFGHPLALDQATISKTNHLGHPPHADNVQFDSVWWDGRQIKQKDELAAARGGAKVVWKDSKTSYRNYSATVSLCDPSKYGGGDLEFYSSWGEKEPIEKHRPEMGDGVAFCGCQRNIHAVTGVKWGFRLVLLIWTRSPESEVPEDQKHVCYFRPGTGRSVWLTAADLQHYPRQRRKRGRSWAASPDADCALEDSPLEGSDSEEPDEQELSWDEEEWHEKASHNRGWWRGRGIWEPADPKSEQEGRHTWRNSGGWEWWQEAPSSS